ncbi:GAF domain-containing SpoIIE family protein phosphatase [Streptomyces sp. NPDC053429]|uniref:GAF domain-containing SpoIIE family protein phosphatase n=1 Tax=Streptomyces sp. NPDC053429 TaxID=3365702 RepID=UPI0037D50E5A
MSATAVEDGGVFNDLPQGSQRSAFSPTASAGEVAPGDMPARALDCLPDAVFVLAAVRDANGRLTDLRLASMNAQARAGRLGRQAFVGELCSTLWPRMGQDGSAATCMRALATGQAHRGAFAWVDQGTQEAGAYEYQANPLSADHLLWILRDDDARALRAQLLVQVTTALAGANSMEAVLEILTRRIMPAVGASVGAAVLDEPGNDMYTVRHIHDDAGPQAPAPFSVTAPYPMAHTARTGRSLFFCDPEQRRQQFPEAAAYFSERHHSTAVLPLVVGDRLFGAVSFHFATRHTFEDSERGFLTALVGQCALAMERARLHHESERARAQLEALAEVSHVLATTLDADATFANVTATVVPRFGEGCMIYVPGGKGSLRLASLSHQEPQVQAALTDLLRRYPPKLQDEDGIGAVIRTGRHEACPDTSRFLDSLGCPPEHRSHVQALLGSSAWLIVPMSQAGTVIGAMVFTRTAPLPESDLAFLMEIAHRATQAVTNAQRFSAESHVARILQQNLLPPALPSLPGIEIAAAYHPGMQGTLVGGDFYDMLATGPDRWALTIGDVCGKGPEAAALTGLVRHTARAAARIDPEPATVLKAVNTAVLTDHPTATFCTALYIDLHIDPTSTGAMARLTLAGHPQPLLRRADGTITRLGTPGLLLGVVQSRPVHTSEHSLRPGDLLLLYTDGVSERLSPAGMLGEEGIIDSLAATRHATAAETVAALEARVLAHGPTAPSDDFAVLALAVRE